MYQNTNVGRTKCIYAYTYVSLYMYIYEYLYTFKLYLQYIRIPTWDALNVYMHTYICVNIWIHMNMCVHLNGIDNILEYQCGTF